MCGSGAAIAQGAATAIQTVGALRMGMQQGAYFDYQARQDAADAAAAQGAAAVNADIVRKAGRLTRSSARASLARAGVEVDSGSAGAVQDSITQEAELDALSQLIMGRYQGRRLAQRGQFNAIQSSMAMRNAMWEAAGTALAGGAKSASMWGKG
jgi:hypothetical protein